MGDRCDEREMPSFMKDERSTFDGATPPGSQQHRSQVLADGGVHRPRFRRQEQKVRQVPLIMIATTWYQTRPQALYAAPMSLPRQPLSSSPRNSDAPVLLQRPWTPGPLASGDIGLLRRTAQGPIAQDAVMLPWRRWQDAAPPGRSPHGPRPGRESTSLVLII